MGRRSTPQPLTLTDSNSLTSAPSRDTLPSAESTAQGVSPADSRSPRSPRSQRSSPFGSRFAAAPTSATSNSNSNSSSSNNNIKRPQTARAALQPAAAAASDGPGQHNLPQPSRDDTTPPLPPISSAFNSPSSTGPPPQGLRYAQTDGKKSATKSGFFSFAKPAKPSTNQPYSQVYPSTGSRDRLTSRGGGGPGLPKQGDSPYTDAELQKPVPAFPSLSDLSLSSSGDHDPASTSSAAKKNKSKSFGLLGRSRSTRDKDYGISPKLEPVPLPVAPSNPNLYENSIPLRTAPVAQDRTFRDMMNSTVRNRSEDRALTRDGSASRDFFRERDQRPQPSLRENGGSTFLSGLRNSSTRAADMISKGLFGKSSRSGSTTERETVVDDEHYVLKVLNLPLVEQARKTRISKRLENSRDKTEFWMPAFPWRAIDYLNYKGCDVEGLYRVPGSGPQIKKWQRKFDEQYDVNLFESHDLYDINIIGSMLKAWLRELPDELFPKDAQDRIARSCADSDEVPQLLIDELSNLSPFNYYLLFAITCHLSLLLAHSDKNKMDFRNLCICFQPCMKIDAFCFRFLVCNWRDCWKGCKQEAKFIEEEYTLFDQPPPRGLSERQRPADAEGLDGPRRSSSDSSRLSNHGNGGQKDDFKKQHAKKSGSTASISTTMTANTDRDTGGMSGDLRPLSPIKPLSPLGF